MGAVVKWVLRVSKENCASLDQRKGTLGEVRAGRDGAEASDDAPVEVGEPQETLQLLVCFWGGPGGDSRDLGRIHPQVVPCYNVSQEGDRGYMEHALLRLDVQGVV